MQSLKARAAQLEPAWNTTSHGAWGLRDPHGGPPLPPEMTAPGRGRQFQTLAKPPNPCPSTSSLREDNNTSSDMHSCLRTPPQAPAAPRHSSPPYVAGPAPFHSQTRGHSSAPSNLLSLFLPQDLCSRCSLSLGHFSLNFCTSGSCDSGHSPNGTSSEKPSLNSPLCGLLSKVLSACQQKCCAAWPAAPPTHPPPLQPFCALGSVTGSPQGAGHPQLLDPRRH